MSLRAIYFQISELDIGTVTARNLDELKLGVKAADCPMRLLLPATEGDMAFVSIGQMTRAVWRIRDLCLWQPIVAGTGLEQCADEMLAYIELYGAAIRTLRNPTAGATITGVTYKIAPILWGATDFWSVDITVEVEEYDP